MPDETNPIQAPGIKIAIPQRRYQVGEYSAVVLGEIESDDGARYEYILALVREGDTKPGLYVTAERNPRGRAEGGSHSMRVISPNLCEVMGVSDDWKDIEAFTAQGLKLAAGILGLGDEQPVRLM